MQHPLTIYTGSFKKKKKPVDRLATDRLVPVHSQFYLPIPSDRAVIRFIYPEAIIIKYIVAIIILNECQINDEKEN